MSWVRRPQRLFLLLAIVFTSSSLFLVQRIPTPLPLGTDVLDAANRTSHYRLRTTKNATQKTVKSTMKEQPVNKYFRENRHESVKDRTDNWGSNNSNARGVCDGYRGVLHIQSGDRGGAAGTIFFIYIVNQLIYADMYQLLPWVHLNNVSQHVYDPLVHGGDTSDAPVSFTMLGGMTIDFVSDGHGRFGFGSYAGAPTQLLENTELTPRQYQVEGTGVWSSYFEPVSHFDPSDAATRKDCQDMPLLRMHYYHMNPGMLFSCPWSVKSWPYQDLARKLAPKQRQGVHSWFAPMRKRGSEIVQKYIRFRPTVTKAVEKLLEPVQPSSCLAVHIRHSDKGGGARKPIPLAAFLPYTQAFLQGGGTCIFLATDSSEVLDEIARSWPARVQSAIVRQSNDTIRSANRQAVFTLGKDNHHRTNIEVLVDILAMSKCRFFLHGFSAVTEAVMYLNYELHEHSVDLEEHPFNTKMEPQDFQLMVQRTLTGN